MASQPASTAPSSTTAKPVAAHPVFPLSQVELQRWYRFAQKGGVGRARARVDKVSQDAARDLMFLEGDEVVVLMDLGGSSYLGFCEGVTGLFNGADVVMQQARLKRPVVSTRSSSATSRPAAPPEQALPGRGSSMSRTAAAESGAARARSRAVGEPDVEVIADRSTTLGGSLSSRRGWVADGLRIAAAEGRTGGGRAGRVVDAAPQEDVQEILTNAYSPELAGAFASPSLPSPSTSSLRRARTYADSPAPSSTSTGMARTPSLLMSPYSDFVDRERDDESVSSMSGHGLTPAQGPFTPVEPGSAWQPLRDDGKAAQPRSRGAPDLRDGPTPTTESFPLDAFPLPAFGDLSMDDAAQVAYSSPIEQLSDELSSNQRRQQQPGARRPSHALAASGVPVPLSSPRQAPSPFSFSPSSSATSALPPSLLSSTDLYADRSPREPKSSGSTIGSTSTSGQHVPGTPTDDPTLAFIFDAYRYSLAQAPDRDRGADSPARSLRDLGGLGALEELADVESPPRAAADDASTLRTYGAASHLRRGLSSAAPSSSTAPDPPHHRPAASSSSLASLDSVRIPRLSEVFPRSGTLDSLASWATETSGGARGPGGRGSVSAEARYAMWSPPTPSKDVYLRRPAEHERRAAEAQGEPAVAAQVERAAAAAAADDTAEQEGPERTTSRREQQRSVPMTDAAHLEQDLAASRRLFHQHFSPPQELVAAAAQQAKLYDHGRYGSIDELPSPSRRQESPGRLRRKSAKGLQISSPAVPALQAVPRWRSAEGASPVEQSLPAAPGDVFAPWAPSSASMPHVEVFGASPSAGSRTWASPRLRDLSQDSQALLPSLESTASPTVSSPQTFTSATSSPVAPSFEDPQDRADARRRPSGSGTSLSKKLRKPLHRAKSSPSLGRQQNDPSTSSFSSGGGTRPPVPTRQGSDPFFAAAAAAAKGKTATSFSSSSKDSSERRRVDYSAGISSKDFEEETVQIGKSEFEIVKPLVALLSQPSESDDGSAESSSAHVPPSAVDHVTPRRPTAPPPPHTPGNNLGLSTPSLSHFSPPTPASVEDGGQHALDDYRKKEAQWVAALGSMSPTQVRKSKKMRALVQAGGVPSSVRGKVWAFLAEGSVEKRQGVYQSLCKVASPAVPPLVEEDLSATLDHPQFAYGSAGRSDIFQVLQAFAHFLPLDYYPGLGSVVGLLLSQMPAEDAFWTLVALVQDYGLRQYFPSAQDELRLETLAFEFLLEAMEPKLARRLRELSVPPSDYLAVWHSTLYLTVLPQPTVLRIVDLLLFDVKARHRVALALLDLSHLDDHAAFPSRDAALNHLLAPPPTAFTPTLLFPAIASTKVSDDKLKKAFVKAAKALET
ncbi:hypothetical protein JCM3775_000861 [Rhodotorula graminis]